VVSEGRKLCVLACLGYIEKKLLKGEIESHTEGKSDNMEDMASGGGGYNNCNGGGATRSSGEAGG
jgi:hypothetical protein